MSDEQEAQEWLLGAKITGVSFPEPGTKIVGQILAIKKNQQREFGTGKPKVYDNGDPMMQVVITLAAEGVAVTDEDDGRRNLYVDKPRMRKAIAQAVRDSGHTGSLIGGRLGVVFTGYGEGEGAQPPKEFGAKFEAPAVGAEAFDDEAPF